MKSREYEKGYPRKSTGDGLGEFSYIYTECGNMWFSVKSDPMYRDNCRCPKCHKIVRVVKEEMEKWE